MLNFFSSGWRFYLLLIFIIANLSYSRIITNSWQKEKDRATSLEEKFSNIHQKYNEQLERLKQISELDEIYTRALQHENNFIDDLHWRTVSGSERLYVAANCKPGLYASPGAASMDDAATPRLSQDAEQAYFTHRRELARAEKVILGLQTYIKEQCTH